MTEERVDSGTRGRSVRHPRGRYRSPVNRGLNDPPPRSARIADRVTQTFGSWSFILVQTALIVLWLAYNGYAAAHFLDSHKFDPYPFILLNLVFSTQAAYAAPLILLSQNRTAERDRIKAEHDFDVNVLALRALAELLGDVHDQDTQRTLQHRIAELLGDEPDAASLTGEVSATSLPGQDQPSAPF